MAEQYTLIDGEVCGGTGEPELVMCEPHSVQCHDYVIHMLPKETSQSLRVGACLSKKLFIRYSTRQEVQEKVAIPLDISPLVSIEQNAHMQRLRTAQNSRAG